MTNTSILLNDFEKQTITSQLSDFKVIFDFDRKPHDWESLFIVIDKDTGVSIYFDFLQLDNGSNVVKRDLEELIFSIKETFSLD